MAKSKPTREVAAYAPGPMNVRCKAHRKNGDQCKRWSIRGATVCATHGGMAPQVRKKAAERIEASLDRAALAIVRLMEDPETPPAVKLAAARDLLDRGNLTGKTAMDLNAPPAPWQVVFQNMIVSTEARAPEDPSWHRESSWESPRDSNTPPNVRHDEPVVVQVERSSPVQYVNTDDTPPRRLDPEGIVRRRGRAKFKR